MLPSSIHLYCFSNTVQLLITLLTTFISSLVNYLCLYILKQFLYFTFNIFIDLKCF